MGNNKFIDSRPVKTETLTAKEFLELIEKKPELIKRSYPKPANLGDSSFGGICVEYYNPVYKTAF